MRALQIICVLFIFLHTSCQQPVSFTQNNNALTIDIQPFTDIASNEANYVYTEIKKIYPKVIIKSPIQLPLFAFYPLRNRYRAGSVIKFLNNNTTDGHITIGLTTKDISTNKDSIADWGVMGLGFCPGKACIASTFRLTKNEKLMQLFKVAIHELGHTQGLPHCVVKTCFMRDAEGHNPTDEEKDFCPDCKKYLEKKGWVFNTK